MTDENRRKLLKIEVARDRRINQIRESRRPPEERKTITMPKFSWDKDKKDDPTSTNN
jgi:hypothetical protein